MSSAVFINYSGMTVSEVTELRSKLYKQNMDMVVAKKTLMKMVAEEQKIGDYSNDNLEGPVAVTFSYEDQVELAKLVVKHEKEQDNIQVIAGIFDGRMVPTDVVKQFASLPSREELLAKFVGSCKAPISGFVMSAKSPMNGFVQALKQVSEQSA